MFFFAIACSNGQWATDDSLLVIIEWWAKGVVA
jgi:hypothetical protein